MIRQAISCDICGAEKRQTNNWFVVHEQAGELRVTGWNSRNRLRQGTKHLCGQTCLHKLVDEFMARTIAHRNAVAAAEAAENDGSLATDTDASLTSRAAYEEVESSARLVSEPVESSARIITPPAQVLAPRPVTPVAAIVPLQPTVSVEEIRPISRAVEARPNYSSRVWRAEAWEREREREMRAGHSDVGERRRRSY